MNNTEFYLACPAFDIIGKAKNKTTAVQAEYAHPIDSGIIKMLNTPVVSAIFKSWVDILSETTYGQVVASGIPVNEVNYPEINEIVELCTAKLGIKKPYVIISGSIQEINAMTFGSDEEPYIAISSLLVKVTTKEQLAFVIGHECGHIAMGHMVYHMVASMAGQLSQFIPIIGPMIYSTFSLPLNAWSRRSEITADRAGLLCCGDCKTAQRALLQLESAHLDASELDIDSYLENCDHFLKQGTLRKLGELLAAHPIIPKRIEALSIFEKSKKYCLAADKDFSQDALSDKELEAQIENIIKVMK